MLSGSGQPLVVGDVGKSLLYEGTSGLLEKTTPPPTNPAAKFFSVLQHTHKRGKGFCKKSTHGAGAIVQWIRALAILAEAGVRFLGPSGESSGEFSALSEHEHGAQTYMHACKKLKDTYTNFQAFTPSRATDIYACKKAQKQTRTHIPQSNFQAFTPPWTTETQTGRHTHTPTQLPGLHTASFRQEVSEGFRIHLLQPVAMETNPSLFFPSGTGNEG